MTVWTEAAETVRKAKEARATAWAAWEAARIAWATCRMVDLDIHRRRWAEAVAAEEQARATLIALERSR